MFVAVEGQQESLSGEHTPIPQPPKKRPKARVLMEIGHTTCYGQKRMCWRVGDGQRNGVESGGWAEWLCKVSAVRRGFEPRESAEKVIMSK